MKKASVSRAARRLIRISDRIKLNPLRKKVKRFHNVAAAMARAYHKESPTIPHSEYGQSYLAKAIRGHMRRLSVHNYL